MKIDAEVSVGPQGFSPENLRPSAGVLGAHLRGSEVALAAQRAESFGFDCLWVNETKHDPFLQLALAAAATARIRLGTSIALAFTRSPTTLAHTSWDLQGMSGGRFILGLGSQVKGHIQRRFGLKWESPAPKMKEVVLALRAIWDSWQKGTELKFEGRFFNLTLMTPFFNPGPIDHPEIPIFVAGVNPGMCKVVGAVGQGLHVHPFHSVRYVREVLRPALQGGMAKAGRKEDEVEVAASVFAAVGDNRREIENVKEAYRGQIAFYASTRSYRRLMELHGWGDVCDRLHEHSVRGEWDRMAGEVSDEMLEEFVVEGTWDEMGQILIRRYDGLADRVRLYLPFDGDGNWERLVRGFRASR